MRETPLPTSKAVRDLLSDLIGRDVDVATGDLLQVIPAAPPFLAVYVTDYLSTAAVIAIDLPLAGYLGGALGLLPVGGINDAIAKQSLPASAVENLSEVLNIAAALFNGPGAPHVKYYTMTTHADSPPSDIAALAGSIGRRMDLVVTVPGYGKGRMSVVLKK